jgi:hypothetical protein
MFRSTFCLLQVILSFLVFKVFAKNGSTMALLAGVALVVLCAVSDQGADEGTLLRLCIQIDSWKLLIDCFKPRLPSTTFFFPKILSRVP